MGPDLNKMKTITEDSLNSTIRSTLFRCWCPHPGVSCNRSSVRQQHHTAARLVSRFVKVSPQYSLVNLINQFQPFLTPPPPYTVTKSLSWCRKI